MVLTLWFWFSIHAEHQSFRVMEASSQFHYIAGSHSLQTAPQRVVHKAMNVKSGVQWKSQEVRHFKNISYLLRKATDFKSEPRIEVSWAIGNKVFGKIYLYRLETHIPSLCAWRATKHWTARYLPSWLILVLQSLFSLLCPHCLLWDWKCTFCSSIICFVYRGLHLGDWPESWTWTFDKDWGCSDIKDSRRWRVIFCIVR